MTALVCIGVVLPVESAHAQPLETVVVPANDSDGVDSTVSLTAGTTYVFDAGGQTAYGFQGGQADVECSTLPPDPTWQRARYLLVDPQSDLLDVLVNGQNVEWRATTADAFGCNSTDHRYALTFTPVQDGKVNFRFYDTGYSDNFGGFAIQIHEAAETLLETIVVPATASGGVNSSVSLDPTKFYRIEASGTGTYDPRGGQFDAECTTFFTGEPVWLSNRWLIADVQGDALDLYLNGQNVAWRPKNPDSPPLGCDSTEHEYDVIFQPRSAGPLHFRVQDSFHGDNAGELTAQIFELEVAPDQAGGPLTPPSISLAEQFEVNSANPNGTTSPIPFRAGDSFLIESIGTYAYDGGGIADAHCSNTPGDPTFRPSEENFPLFDPRILQLVLNNTAVDWRPATPDTVEMECDSTTHTYRLIFQPEESGFVNFRIFDTNHADNGGSLTVKVFRIREIPVGRVSVNSASPAGTSTPPLLEGRDYRLRGTGTYDYWLEAPDSDADSECSQAGFPPVNDLTYERNRFGTGNDDLLDVFVNNSGVSWRTSGGSTDDCDVPDHAYDHLVTASSTAPANLKVMDGNYGDNVGSVTVDIFLQAS